MIEIDRKKTADGTKPEESQYPLASEQGPNDLTSSDVVDVPILRPWCNQWVLPSGKRLHNYMERSTIFNGKINYFNGHFQ